MDIGPTPTGDPLPTIDAREQSQHGILAPARKCYPLRFPPLFLIPRSPVSVQGTSSNRPENL